MPVEQRQPPTTIFAKRHRLMGCSDYAALTFVSVNIKIRESGMVRILLIAVAIGVGAVGLAPVAAAERPYKNCTEAHQDGRYDIPQDDPAYWSGGDRDGDGYACDS